MNDLFLGETVQAPGDNVRVAYPVDLSRLAEDATVTAVVVKDVTRPSAIEDVTAATITGSSSGSGASYQTPLLYNLELHHIYHVILLTSAGANSPAVHFRVKCEREGTAV